MVHAPHPRPSESLRFLFDPDGPAHSDAWGVSVLVDDEARTARLAIDVPQRLPTKTRARLKELECHTIRHTTEDADWDMNVCGTPTSYLEASPFARAILEAVTNARDTVSDAVFAYARQPR